MKVYARHNQPVILELPGHVKLRRPQAEGNPVGGGAGRLAEHLAVTVCEVDEAAPALEGLELDDISLRRQQMLSQITDMVTETPDEAAGLLRRWIKSEA